MNVSNGNLNSFGVKKPNSSTIPSSGNIAPKKLVIKNFKETPRSPENYESISWNYLSNAIESIYKKQAIPQTLEELYRMVDNLCSEKLSTSLYSKLSDQIERHAKQQLQALIGVSSDINTFLSLMNKCWKDHSSDLILIMSIFLCLDRINVGSKNTKSIWDLGLYYYKINLKSSQELEGRLKSGLLQSIERERNGESVDKDLLHNLIKMLISLQMYEGFEKELIGETSKYYYRESNIYVIELEVADYLKHVQDRMNEEANRSLRYLDPSTKRSITLVIEQQMLERHADHIIQKGFNVLVSHDRIEDLARLYTLFMRINSLALIKTAWAQYVKKVGSSIVSDTEKDVTMITDLISLKDRLDRILDQSFQRNDTLSYSLKESFEYFINIRQNKPAELIARFIDSKLRSGNKGMNDDELESNLNKALVLFRCIQGKDVFEAFYKVDLSKRLLMEKSISIDSEKSMVLKLRNECGASFTTKLEGMFNDIELSNDVMAAFKESSIYGQCRNIEMNVYVLASGNWPSYNQIDAILPNQFIEYQELYKKFYSTKYQNRKLNWQNSLGQCVLKSNFSNSKKEIICSLLQSVVLLLFNDLQDGDELTLKKIQELTGVEIEELKRHVQPLSSSKTRILGRRSKSKSKTLEMDDLFYFNKDFTHKLMRIKVNALQAKETVEENKKTNDNILQDRQYQIDAAIVRIMKTRKTLTHNLLMTELFQQLRFTPKPVDLKKRIESLIEREYLGRDSSNPNNYNYIA